MSIIAKYSKGNNKLDKNIRTFSRTPIKTCPGATEWCKKHCYDLKSYNRWPSVKKNRDNHINSEVPNSQKKAKQIRIHVGGDFDTIEYIQKWKIIIRNNPDKIFYAYTKSWIIPELKQELESLRELPNMQLFASIDSSTPTKEYPDWRLAFLEDVEEKSGLLCPEQTGKKKSCEDCKYCFIGKRGNVIFKAH